MKLDISCLILTIFAWCVVKGQDVVDLTIRPWLYRPDSDFLYQFNDGENTWDLAREYCLAQGGDLVSIKNASELQWVLDHYPIYPNRLETRDRPVLIGLNKLTSKGWAWTDDQSSYDPTLLPWGIGEPSGVEDCAAFDAKERKLRDIACDIPQPYPLRIRFACKAEIGALINRTLSASARRHLSILTNTDNLRLCPNGFFNWKDSCYLLTGHLSWFEAKVFCEGQQAVLTSIHSNDTTAFLQRLYDQTVTTRSLFGYWVGASDEVDEDKWVWLDGTKWDYVVWSNSWAPYVQPTGKRFENCLAVATDQEFHDFPCTEQLPAVCQRPTKLYTVAP